MTVTASSTMSFTSQNGHHKPAASSVCNSVTTSPGARHPLGADIAESLELMTPDGVMVILIYPVLLDVNFPVKLYCITTESVIVLTCV